MPPCTPHIFNSSARNVTAVTDGLHIRMQGNH